MDNQELRSRLDFIRTAEQLKQTCRSAHTSNGKVESVAEHTWRVLLLLITYADSFPDADLLKLLKMAVLHDLGEAINGDIPAPEQTDLKSAGEREDFISLLAPLPEHVRHHFIDLWDEYEAADTPEAKLAKAFDKIETIVQHNQGQNPPDFDYQFNLQYGRKYTDALTLTKMLRVGLDEDTKRRSEKRTAATANLRPVEIKAFVPAIDYNLSKAFYQDMGFTMASDTEGVAYFCMSDCSFLLVEVEPPYSCTGMMMHLLVENIEDWHRDITDKNLVDNYAVEATALVNQPWGMREFIISDPAGIKWRIAQNV